MLDSATQAAHTRHVNESHHVLTLHASVCMRDTRLTCDTAACHDDDATVGMCHELLLAQTSFIACSNQQQHTCS